jgi:hypothetical protein
MGIPKITFQRQPLIGAANRDLCLRTGVEDKRDWGTVRRVTTTKPPASRFRDGERTGDEYSTPWPPEDRPRDPGPDSTHEPGQPAVGSSAHDRSTRSPQLQCAESCSTLARRLPPPPMYLPTVDSGTKSLSHEPGGGESGAVLQQARHDRAMDQGRKSQTHKSIYRLSPPPKVRTERNLQNSRLNPDETGSPVDLAYQIAAKCAFFTRGRREFRKLKTRWWSGVNSN